MSDNGGKSHPGTIGEEGLVPMKYVLEVHAPDDQRVVQLESKDPFGAISTGDLINIRAFTGIAEDYPNQLWRVVQIEHMVYDSFDTHVMHQIVIFTDEETDTYETRQMGESG